MAAALFGQVSLLAASTASGFFFSLSECRWLAEKFKMRGVSDGVDYKSFFLWATESASRVQAVSDKLRTGGQPCEERGEYGFRSYFKGI